jgi:hypothetical protein
VLWCHVCTLKDDVGKYIVGNRDSGMV